MDRRDFIFQYVANKSIVEGKYRIPEWIEEAIELWDALWESHDLWAERYTDDL